MSPILFFFIILLISFLPSDSLRFSSVDDILPINVASESRSLVISTSDVLAPLEISSNYVLLGGRNAAYNISLWDLAIRHVVHWPTSENSRLECEKILQRNCDNFVRLFYNTNDGFVLCGTHGRRPSCRRFLGDWERAKARESLPGEGLSPFFPAVKAPFLHVDGRLFAANAPEYSASDAIFLRKNTLKGERPMRTARGESAFDNASFISMESDGQEVLTFFNELPSDAEGCGLRRVARVARVCKDDPGAVSFPDEWSSFVKARLECSVTQPGHDSLLFNQLTAFVSSPSNFAGVFRSQLAGLGFSAICLFPRSHISSTLASPFKSSNGCPRAVDDQQQRALRGNSLISSKISSEPIFVYSGDADVTAVAVQHNVTNLAGAFFDVFYLGTSRGQILKVVIGGGNARHVATLAPLRNVEETRSLWLRPERLANQKKTTSLFLLTNTSLTKVPTNVCGSASNCSACLAMGDPQCAWILHGAECVALEENLFRLEYLTQQIGKCPRPPPVPEPRKPAPPLPCLCQRTEPCVTQVIQKEVQPVSLFSNVAGLGSMFVFSLGLLGGSLLNCLCARDKQYMTPFTATVELVVGVINGAAANMSVDQLQRMIIGLCRDLRGVALACTSKTTYQMLFDWLYPNVFKIMLKCVEEWSDNREVVISVFRLLEELCQNRQERLKFELNSCSAVLMFKETSKIVTEYGTRYLHLPACSKENMYKLRYKVIASLFRCVKYTLVGAYVPFGVFRLYGDWCLRDVLLTFIKLFRTLPEEDIMAYPKLSEAYYSLLENVVHTNMPFISNIEPEDFTCVLRSISGGVTSLNSTVSTSSCSTLDDLLTYLYKRLTRPNRTVTSVGAEPEGDNCIKAMEKNPEVLADMLTTMISALVFNEVKCQWSMSRPLLGLILLQEEIFENYKRQLIQSIPADRQPVFGTMFESLMQGVDRSLTVKNKDNFTHNLHKFRRDVMDVLKMGPPNLTGITDNGNLIDMS